MAENSKIYYGSGIGVAGNIDIGALGLPADSRVMVKDRTGLTELQNAKRVYDGMLVYVESDQTYHKCRVIWDANMAITSCTWTEVVIKSEQELINLITSSTTAAMEFKGAIDALPESGIKGDMYKVSGSFEVAAEADAQGEGFTTKVGDSIVYDGEKWYHIPSGDDIEDTWRTITGVNNDADLTFAAGDLLDVSVAATGTVTYSHEVVAAPINTNADGDEKVREYITAVETDGHGHITGFKTNVETVVDTSYEFEGTTTDSNVSFSVQKKIDGTEEGAAEVIKIDAYTQSEVDAAIKVVTDGITTDRAVWDLAGTAVQTEAFNTFKNENTQAIAAAMAPKLDTQTFTEFQDTNTEAINAAKQAGIDAANGVDTKLTNYINAHTSDYTNEQIDNAISTATGNLGSMSTKDASDYYTKEDVAALGYALDTDAQNYANTAQTNAEAKAAELDAALKQELTGTINGVDAKFANYVTTAKYAEDKLAEDAIDTDHESRIAAVEAKFGTGEGTVEAQIAAAIESVQDQIDALDDTYATDTEVAGVKSELEGKIDLKASLEYVNGEFAKYTNTEAQAAIDKAQDDRIKELEEDRVTENDLAEAIKDFETKGNVAKVAQDLADYESSNNQAVADRYTKGEADAKFETIANVNLVKADVAAMYTNAKIDELIAEAKKYADDNDANTTYGITYDSENKKIKLVAGETSSEIDASAFIKDGMIESVELSADGKNLVITWNTDADKGENNVTTIPLSGLVDIYTGVVGDRITVSVSSDNKVSADIVAGSITKNYFDTSVQTSLGYADTAFQQSDFDDFKIQYDLYTSTHNVSRDEFSAEISALYTGKADASVVEAMYTNTQIDNLIQGARDFASSNLSGWETNIFVPYQGEVSGELAKKQDIIPANTYDAYGSAAQALQDAKDYADGLDHEDTTYTFAPTANALEFTATPNGKGEAQTIKLVAPDAGVMSIEAGNDIVVTPSENGKVTVAHETFTTGEYTKDPATSDKTGDQYFFTGVSVDNGHVTGANVKSLASVLEAMTFILDGGTSTT